MIDLNADSATYEGPEVDDTALPVYAELAGLPQYVELAGHYGKDKPKDHPHVGAMYDIEGIYELSGSPADADLLNLRTSLLASSGDWVALRGTAWVYMNDPTKSLNTRLVALFACKIADQVNQGDLSRECGATDIAKAFALASGQHVSFE